MPLMTVQHVVIRVAVGHAWYPQQPAVSPELKGTQVARAGRYTEPGQVVTRRLRQPEHGAVFRINHGSLHAVESAAPLHQNVMASEVHARPFMLGAAVHHARRRTAEIVLRVYGRDCVGAGRP